MRDVHGLGPTLPHASADTDEAPPLTADVPAKERPILFSAPMVLAVLDGRKTQTRRLVKPTGWTDPEYLGKEIDMWSLDDKTGAWHAGTWIDGNPATILTASCPYGAAGDRLWVRETFFHEPAEYMPELSSSQPVRDEHTAYRADFPEHEWSLGRWKPSIFMPRELSRISLDVAGVRVQRLQDITEEDARAEGIVETGHFTWGVPDMCEGFIYARLAFAHLWDRINGKRASWESNPWVWVVEFTRVQ